MHERKEISQETLDQMTITEDYGVGDNQFETDELSNTVEFLGNLLESADFIDVDTANQNVKDELYEIADELILFLE